MGDGDRAGERRQDRRTFLKGTAAAGASLLLGSRISERREGKPRRPNLVFVFADQWRAQATGYAGNGDVRTPHLDRLAAGGVNLTHAVSTCPVCSPYRATMLTGRYPLSHGVFMNDVCLRSDEVTIAEVYAGAGYETGYIGKWHLDGHGRSSFIPPARRQGFRFWRAMECTHDYNSSFYYAEGPMKRKWPGYDAIAQTAEARRYIRNHADGGSFALFLSWGPPHAPYHTAPAAYRSRFDPEKLEVRPNVPERVRAAARRTLAGYYAHIAALDDCIGRIVRTLAECGLEEDTILVFTSDHGDMLYCQGHQKKQQPWDESIRVPLLIRYPAALGNAGRRIDMPFGTPDIMPTLLGLSGLHIPAAVEGSDRSAVLRGQRAPAEEAALIMCPQPFGQWSRRRGGKEYRGIRTRRYTYVRDLEGPWLLYDNEEDPYQLVNLCNRPSRARLQARLDALLARKLEETRDRFLPGPAYIAKWGYTVDETGTVPYTR